MSALQRDPQVGLQMDYVGRSGVHVGLTDAHVGLAVASHAASTGAPRLTCEIVRPAMLRDALVALHGASVLDDRITRRGPRDASTRPYAEWLYGAEQERVVAHDALLSVYADAVLVEACSGDGRVYARVLARNGLFHRVEDRVLGTARCEIGARLASQLGRLRGYRKTTLAVGAEGLAVGIERGPRRHATPVTRRAFARLARVQSALALADGGALELNAADVAVLCAAAARADRSAVPRALTFELVRGARVRAQVEPGAAPVTLSAVWRGEDRSVRVWGRDALAVVGRVAHVARRVRLWLGASGAPWLWALELGELSFVLAIAGGAADAIDLLAPPDAHVAAALESLAAGSTLDVARAARIGESEARAALVRVCAAGLATAEPAAGFWRARAWLGSDHAALTASLQQSTTHRRKGGEGRSKEEATRARV